MNVIYYIWVKYVKKIELLGMEYEIVSDDSKCVDKELLTEKVTDYFKNYDYIFGDYSYDKVRLKGYYDSNNKKVTEINDIKHLEKYKAEYCSYGAKTFLLKKLK